MMLAFPTSLVCTLARRRHMTACHYIRTLLHSLYYCSFLDSYTSPRVNFINQITAVWLWCVELHDQCSSTSSASNRNWQLTHKHFFFARTASLAHNTHPGNNDYYGNRGDSLNDARQWYYIRPIENIYPQ